MQSVWKLRLCEHNVKHKNEKTSSKHPEPEPKPKLHQGHAKTMAKIVTAVEKSESLKSVCVCAAVAYLRGYF